MPEISYVPSDDGWTVLRSGQTLLAVKLAADSDPAALWALVSSGAASGQILDELIRAGISSAPEFALVSTATTSAANVLVRGAAVFSASGATGKHDVGGKGVSSWVEQVVDASLGFELRLSAPRPGAVTLFLQSGVVLAASVRAGAESEVAPSATVVSEPVAAPSAPVPEVPAPAPAPGPLPPPPPAPTAGTAEEDLEATLASESTTIGPPPAATVDGGGYDHLFGETVFRKVEDAAVRADGSDEDADPPITVVVDEAHDGHTVLVSDLAEMRARRKATKAAAAAPAEPVGPTFYLELSTGGREVLDQPIVFGRAPSATRVPGGNVPRIVSMNTPNQDISRTHAQVSVEGGTVVVTDLHSSNGTIITLPGKPPQKLRGGEPAAVIVGSIIDMGDGATLTVCEQR